MRHLYTLILYLLLPLALLALPFHRGLRAGWRQRLGWYSRTSAVDVWVHAASVGEVLAARPLIEALLREHPHLKMLVTTNTSSGAEFVSTSFQGKVQHCYLPFDLPFMVSRFLAVYQPRLGLILETELWPNLFHVCHGQGVKLALTNGRLSVRTFGLYLRWRSLFADALGKLQVALAQSEEDADRYRQLGMPAQRLVVTGNLKFEQPLPPDLDSHAAALRHLWGERPVWLAASTRDEEEAVVLQAFRQVREYLPECLLVIAPRHPRRFDEVAQLVAQQGWCLSRRSQQQRVDMAVDVYLADTLGELPAFYAAAQVVFIGGSLVPLGGHNPLEAAAVGKGAIIGPHDFNFHAVYAALQKAEAVCQVKDAHALAAAVQRLFEDTVGRERMGRAALEVLRQNQGALHRTLEKLLPLLEETEA